MAEPHSHKRRTTMAHELMESDNMISVRELPWHGLGIVLDDYPTIQEAQRISGLTWSVRKEPVHYRMPAVDGLSRIMAVPGAFAVVRNDNNYPLGIVGAQYEPYQNDQMFEFMDTFMQAADSKIETCGSLRNGRTVWAMAQAGTVEFVKNDPTIQYFLIKNGFDGMQNIEICFTNVRVVCNNTLTAALRGASNVWRVRHTSSLHDQMDAVQGAIFSQKKHAEAMRVVMDRLISFPLTQEEIARATAEIVMGDIKDAEALLEEGQDILESATNHQRKTVRQILELHESGAGTDIPGVRGTAYGLLNACTEYADHFRIVRPGERSLQEARFESIMMGSAHAFKARAFDHILSIAA